ncbi:MAG: hypothetical protein ABJE95_09325 [Byssovorax sp.]
MRDFLRVLLVLPTLWIVACATGPNVDTSTSSGSTGGGDGSSSSSGTGGSDLGPCGVDCSGFKTPDCTMSVCNTGEYLGPLNTCIVVPSKKGTPCDDGLFCTKNDSCDSGACVGGTQNDCGLPHSACATTLCYEETKSCDVTPVAEGGACVPADLCQVNGVCHVGDCVGEPKDCSFSPMSECNTVACESVTGKCVPTPDAQKDDAPCLLSGDLCITNKTCKAGQCGGGKPRDCSAFNVGCQVGLCDGASGICGPGMAPIGTSCAEGVPECQVGACDDKGACKASSAADGAACNDHNSCSKADKCLAGACTGAPVASCSLYLNEGFEVCPNGWTFGGDWQCGKPTMVGPIAAHTGMNVVATKIADNYSVNQSFTTTVADSPSIDLTTAVSPQLSFWAWDHTEGGTFDGWNLNVSINGGTTFTEVTKVTPVYTLTVNAKPSWGGDHSLEGWQHYTADLKDYIGQPIILRFAFRSDGATVFPGVYLDDVVVAEPLQNPLLITTPSPLMDIYGGMAYAAPIAKTGGTNASAWSLLPGGVNAAWLNIDPAAGVLKGTPPAALIGPVTVTVHVEEPTLPSNFAEKTFTFNVNHALFYTSFEDVCPNNWTLVGDWQCGVPANVGPATAYVGTQCLATQIASNYTDNQPWTTTASSPDIDLTNAPNAKLTFRMWVDTEGSTYDGANLQISTDGGVNYAVVNNATPAYPLLVAGKAAWGGHQAALGWQAVQADLSAYAGQIIRIQFAFRSDTSGTFPGVYIDDILVN